MGMETTDQVNVAAVGTGCLVLEKEKHHPVILLSFVSDLCPL